jgi:O-antigen/teichoic acid export membrane protein
MHSLRKKTLISLYWSSSAKLISQGVTFFSTILLAKLLGTRDFGLMSLSLVYIGFIQMFIDAGFLHALIQRSKVEQKEYASCFWFLLVAGSVMFAFTFLLKNTIDNFFNTPGIGQVIIVQSSIFIFLPFRTIAQAILSRDVRIDILSKLEAVLNIIRFAFSILMAWKGAGVWSLVIPMLVCEIAYSLACYYLAAWRVSLEFSWQILKPLALFGVNISLSRVVWFAASRADQLIIGRLLGAESLGIYSMALQFANVISQFASSTLSRVIFPVFSRLQADLIRLNESYLSVTRYTITFLLPAFIGVGLVAPDLIKLAFKPIWYQAIVPMQYLSILAFLRLCESISGFLVNARGKSQLNVLMNILALVLMSLGVFVGAGIDGLRGVSIMATISFVPIMFLTAVLAVKEIEGDFSQYMRLFGQPLIASLVMATGVILISELLTNFNNSMRIAAMASTGVILYVITTLILNKDFIRQARLDLTSYKPA